MLIYCDKLTDRLDYTLQFVFGLRGLSYDLTTDFAAFVQHKGPKLNYSDKNAGTNILQLKPARLLFEEHVELPETGLGHFLGEAIITIDGLCDPLAAIFFILTRMEEYAPKTCDLHGRFPAEASVLKQYKLLHLPVCDRWAEALLRWLSKHPDYSPEIRRDPVRIIPSFDIDNAFAYLHKNFSRRMLSNAKDMLNGNKRRLKERKAVLKRSMNDPYDTFEFIRSVAKRYETYVFWLLADFGKYDKNLPHTTPALRKLICEVDQLAGSGIHPGYASERSETVLRKEQKRLETIIGKPVIRSRQHFLKVKFPGTYRRLIRCGITADFTMGFAQDYGFRLGTARTIHWFDLERNEATELKLHPFVYMDGTFNEYLGLSPEESKHAIRELYEQVKQYGGDFCFIWHNETIGDYGKWKNWKHVLEFTLTLNDA